MTDRRRALAVLIAVFLLGCILGSAGSYLWLRKSSPDLRDRAQRNGPRPPAGRQSFQELLQLTPEQDARFKQIMAESRKQLDALQGERIAKIEAIRSETNRELSSILGAEQQKKFDAFLKEIAKERRHQPRGRSFAPPP